MRAADTCVGAYCVLLPCYPSLAAEKELQWSHQCLKHKTICGLMHIQDQSADLKAVRSEVVLT